MIEGPVENLNGGNAAVPERKKFTFKKRDPVEAARLEVERKASIKNVRLLQAYIMNLA
jgi:hypothetical protein